MTAPEATVLAFDVGGSHIAAALCSLANLRILHRASAPLHDDISAEAFIALIHGLAEKAKEHSADIAGAAFAVPGPFDAAAGVSYMKHKLKALYGVNLRAALAQSLGMQAAQLAFLNDAAAFLLGEVEAGAAQGAERAIGIALGTGIGSAFAVSGEWVPSGAGVPEGGEIWNHPYRGGIVEDLISTRALRKAYLGRTGRDEEVAALAARAETDADARAVFGEFGANLGHVLRDVCGGFAPATVVIGGGISRSAALFLPAAEEVLRGSGFTLATARLLDEAHLVGAAAWWRRQTRKAA